MHYFVCRDRFFCWCVRKLPPWKQVVAAVLAIAGILLLLGPRAAIFLNKSEVNETPSALIEESVPRITSQWDCQPRKARRACATLDSLSTETSDGLSSDPFGINDNVRFDLENPKLTVGEATTKASM
jgi:hypothetical protein